MTSLSQRDPPVRVGAGECVFTTRLPAVTDVFVSGRNVGALRPGRRVGFR